MPRRNSLGGRLRGIAKRFLGGGPKKQSSPPPVPPPLPVPPPAPPAPPQPPGVPVDTRMLRQYQRVTGTTTGFLDWRDLYDSLSMRFENDTERVHFFDEFLRAFYLTSSEPGSIPRRRFYNDTNLPQSAIDWGEWRELKRGTT